MASPDPFAKHFLDRAARHALRGAGFVEPNPMVGAVLVKEGMIIGEGHHRRYGGLHAEREALADARRRGHDPRGCTVYCTLEPCRHEGKQPPCTLALIEAGVARVVFARRDPQSPAAGGREVLEAAGIACEETRASMLARHISDPFVKRVNTGLPWVTAKWAQTIDGRVATRSGESKWISNEQSRARVHRLRGRVDAVLAGIGTVVADDPMLTARGPRPPRRRAARVVVDTDLSTPTSTALAKTAREYRTIIACDAGLTTAAITAPQRAEFARLGVELLGVPPDSSGRGLDLEHLLRGLWQGHGLASILVESGPGMLGALLTRDLVDEAVVYMAPLLLGDEMARSVAVGTVAESLSSAKRFALWRVKALGNDVEVTYRRR